MPRHQRPARSPRRGYTLIELVVSSASAAVLMAGLASSLLISSRVFDGSYSAAKQGRAATVQADMLHDLSEALAFTSRSSTAATFTVPDRDGDMLDEILTYSWSGPPDAELTLAQNGGPAVVLLDEVEDFRFTYRSRFIAGGTSSPPPLDPSQWGERWRKPAGVLGYDQLFPEQITWPERSIATLATLPEKGRVTSISVYLEQAASASNDVTVALFSANQNNAPESLLASSGVTTITASGWVTFNVSPVTLAPGNYFLAFSYKKDTGRHLYSPTDGTTWERNSDAVKKGWESTWTEGGSITHPYRISIYANYEKL